jgi:NAD(P)-dependent dehydrogenase (short-subunit alcohol dehydrogenase family)
MTKTVVITGASSGIGLASAIAAAQAGLITVATVRQPRGATALREVASRAGVAVDVLPLDVVDPESITRCVQAVIDRHGHVDALVNNAGVAGSNPTLELCDLDDLRSNMDVNFFGVIAMSKAMMPYLRAGWGAYLTAACGVVGQPFNEGYSAKFAIGGSWRGWRR